MYTNIKVIKIIRPIIFIKKYENIKINHVEHKDSFKKDIKNIKIIDTSDSLLKHSKDRIITYFILIFPPIY